MTAPLGKEQTSRMVLLEAFDKWKAACRFVLLVPFSSSLFSGVSTNPIRRDCQGYEGRVYPGRLDR